MGKGEMGYGENLKEKNKNLHVRSSMRSLP